MLILCAIVFWPTSGDKKRTVKTTAHHHFNFVALTTLTTSKAALPFSSAAIKGNKQTKPHLSAICWNRACCLFFAAELSRWFNLMHKTERLVGNIF